MQTKPFPIFYHLGKTGGTALHYIFNNNLPGYISLNSYKKFGNHKPFSDLALNKLLKISCNRLQGIGGHFIFPYFEYEKVLMRHSYSPFMITFLRNPIKRYISFLNHKVVNEGLDWDFDYLISREDYHNKQTQDLTQTQNADTAIQFIKDKFSFVGLTENFDEGLLILKDLYPEPLMVNYEKKNVIQSKNKVFTLEKLTNSQLEQIKRVNSEDLKLYSFVKEDFYPAMKQQYSERDIREDLRIFQLNNQSFKFDNSSKIWHKAKNQLTKMVLQPLTRI